MNNNNLIELMINKSIEAFLLGVEIYNKPTIKYRLEGITFLLSNAWELLLKAYIIKNFGEESIYYKNKENRTITITDSIKKVFTNEKDNIRKNLEIIIGLRNTSTHYIIPEYEESYLPFIQSNVLNYANKLNDFFDINISDHISSNFLTFVINPENTNLENISKNYGKKIFEKYLKTKKELDFETSKNNKNLSIPIVLNAKIVKNEKDSDFTVSISNQSENSVQFIKNVINTDYEYPYTQRAIRNIVQKKLEEENIFINFHQTNLEYICKEYNLKNNTEYYYLSTTFNNQYRCSEKLISFLISLFVSNPKILEELRIKYKKRN